MIFFNNPISRLPVHLALGANEKERIQHLYSTNSKRVSSYMKKGRSEVTNRVADASLISYTRVAGLSYVIIILLGIFSVSFIDSNIVVLGNDAATFNNMMAHEFRFRISVVSELVMYALVILLSLALYVVLKTVNRNLALMALLWRLGEGIIGGGVAVISGLIPLLLLNGDAAFGTEQLQALVGLFLGVRKAGLDVVLMFIGLGGTVFCYLFFISKYVPRILAAWGIFTYLSMLILSFASILSPDLPETIRVVLYAPGGLFEIVFGLWLLIKGASVQRTK